MTTYIMPKPGVIIGTQVDTIIFNTDRYREIQNVLPPNAYHIEWVNNTPLIALPYKDETLKILKNLQFDITGLEVMRHRYQPPKVEGVHEFMRHQVATAVFLACNPRAFCTSTMRTGKTAATIAALDYLQSRREIGAALIVCTVNTMGGTWAKEIEGMLPNKKVTVLYGSVAERKELLQQASDYYIINYDGMKLLQDELCSAVDNNIIGAVVLDELTHFSNTQTKIWDAADRIINGTRWQELLRDPIKAPDGTLIKVTPKRRRLASGKAVPFCWGLTGTPGGPDKVYGQIKLVNPKQMPMAFTSWRESTMYKAGFSWKPAVGHDTIIYNTMQPCIRFDKKDVLDLPPVVFDSFYAPLTKEQEKLYKKLKDEMVAAAETGEEITAINKAALISKLLQVAGGVVIGEKKTVYLDADDRIKLLREIIDGTQQKVVVFAAFTAVIDMLKEKLSPHYTVGVVDGRVTGNRREIFEQFQNEKDPHVLICHPKTTAFGVELAAADTIVFYGAPMSGTFVYQQAVERLSSLKQKSNQISIIHLQSTAEERNLFTNIKAGVSINESINKLFTSIIK